MDMESIDERWTMIEPDYDEALVDILAAQAGRGYDLDKLQDRPLSPLQIDILELEDASFGRPGVLPGQKLNEFRCRHPDVTVTGYGLALMRLLHDRRAYEFEGGRYAPTLNRIAALHAEQEAYRARLRGEVADER